MTGDEAESMVERPPERELNPDLAACVVCGLRCATPVAAIRHQGEEHSFGAVQRAYAERDAATLKPAC